MGCDIVSLFLPSVAWYKIGQKGIGGACFENIPQFSVISFPGYLTLQKVQSSQWYCNKEEGGGGDIDNPGLGAWLGPYQQARLHHRMHQHHH